MANVQFQRASALALTLLMLIPGAGFAALPLLTSPEAPAVVPPAAERLTDQALAGAFVGAFGELDDVPGAADLVSLQPTLESILRLYALERGFPLTPPVTPDVSAAAPLAPALQALATATGKPVAPQQLQVAAALPAELQRALARIVLAYLQAGTEYAAALGPLSMADLARVARGEPPSVQPDAGRMASAALLLDRAVRESAPALRKWGLLLTLEERSLHPNLGDFRGEDLLRASANVTDLRDMTAMAAALRGFLPPGARFQPTSASAAQSWAGLYDLLGVPPLATDRAAFALLDQQGPAMQDLAVALGDGVAQAAQALLEAEAMVSEAELAEAQRALAAMDLDAIRAADPATLDLAPLARVVDVLERADRALLTRLEGAAVLADAMTLAGDLAGPLAGGAGTDSHDDLGLPGVPSVGIPQVPLDVPNVGRCVLGEGPGEEIYLDCDNSQVGNITLPNAKPYRNQAALSFGVFIDSDGNHQPDENEWVFQTPPLADPGNDIALKDPYGFLLVGGNGTSVFDGRYGYVNVSLGVENGTIRLERRYLHEDGRLAPTTTQAFDLLDAFVPGGDANQTLFEPQYNGLINLTMNPQNATLLSLDLGGDDVYTLQPGGSNEVLRVYNSSFEERYGASMPNTPGPGGCNTLVVYLACGPGGKSPVGEDDLSGHAIIIEGINLYNLDEPDGYTAINFSNTTLPIRLGAAVDLSGNDLYQSPFNFTMGASSRGIGALWDRERCHPEASPAESSGCTARVRGDDTYSSVAYSQGYAERRGVGLFLDERGDDVHVAGNHSLGDGMLDGYGLAVDLAGNDRWFGENYTMGTGGQELLADPDYNPLNPNSGCNSALQSCSSNLFFNSYAGWLSAWNERKGLGVLLDRRGDDRYGQVNATSNQGKGWPALGLLLDLGGVDQGLQVNLTTTGPFGTIGVGTGENNYLAWGGTSGPDFTHISDFGRGGGVVIDAEMPAVNDGPQAPRDPVQQGFGLGAIEVQGETNEINCPDDNTLTTPIVGQGAGGPGNFRCTQPESGDLEWMVFSRQPFLLRIPGAFGLGGTLSNDGFEAPRNDEEHLLGIDLGGDDRYRGPHAGAALPNLTRLDTEGQPQTGSGQDFRPQENVTMAPLFQAGLIAPVALLVDVAGADTYDGRSGMLGGQRRNVTTPTLGGAWMGLGLLHDLGRACDPAVAESCDLPGRVPPPGCATPVLDDVYLGFNRTMGHGSLFGIGALVDADGNDCYLALTGDGGANLTTALSYSQGVGRLGGVGVLLDARGDDRYLSGNFSQGAGVLEPTNDHLPRRVSLPGQRAIGFHGPNPSDANQVGAARTQAQSLGALVDARGHDTYAFGDRSQGYGETRRNGTESGNPAVGDRKATAGLFVDDGFESDAYLNASWAAYLPAHRDNAFWCSQANLGPLSDETNSAGATLGDLNNQTLGGLDTVGAGGPTADSAHANLGRAGRTAREGPNAGATCLRLDPTSGTSLGSADLGSLGRGYDNLDFFANFLLAAGTFGQEFVRARSVLSAPAVVGIGCSPEFAPAVEPTDCGNVSGLQRVGAKVLWAPASLLYNSYQLLRHICAQATGDDAACMRMLFNEDPAQGGSVTLRDLCQGANPTPPDPSLSCGNLIRDAYNPAIPIGGTVQLNLNLTSLWDAGSEASSGLGAFKNSSRRVEFALRPVGADVDIPLGAYDRRSNRTCHLNFTGDCSGNVTVPAATGHHYLKWDTTATALDPDGIPRPIAPDGNYRLVVTAYFQPDYTSLTPGLSTEDQRHVLNRLGDEYGFYPGVGVQRVAVDNAPAVLQLQYQDISLDFSEEANHALRLNITASPRPLDAAGAPLTPPYQVRAALVPREDGLGGLPARVLACGEDGAAPADLRRVPLDRATCWRETPPNGTARQRIVAGWSEDLVRAALQDGRYALQVDVQEPAHGEFPLRGSVACFVRHGLELERVEEVLDRGVARKVALATVVEDPTQEWVPGAFKDQWVRVTNATLGVTQERQIKDNNATALDLYYALVPGIESGDRYEVFDRSCHSPLAVDSVKPVTVARFDPVRVGADGQHYVNRTVAYPGPLGIADRAPLVVPLRFDTLNLAEKRSPVLYYDVHARIIEHAMPEADFPGFQRVREVRQFVGPAVGNLTIPVCANTEQPSLEEREVLGPCVQVKVPEAGSTAAEALRAMNESRSVFTIDVQVSAIDLAGNVDLFVPADDGGPAAEDRGIVDIDPPRAKVCQPQATGRQGLDPAVPRIRTREPVIPMPWNPGLAGCQGGIAPRDNHAVEAVVIGYGVTTPDEPADMRHITAHWQPPAAQQAAQVARFDFAERNLTATLTNNMTLQFLALARDQAGNVQDRLLTPWRVSYDTRPPDVAVLDLTAEHDRINYRWFAKDAEAPPARVGKAYVAWGTTNATTGIVDLDQLTEVAVGGTTARAVLQGLRQATTYHLVAITLDDVGNAALLPPQVITTDPIANVVPLEPRPGDVLVGSVPVRWNVSDVRVDPVLTYNLTLVVPLEPAAASVAGEGVVITGFGFGFTVTPAGEVELVKASGPVGQAGAAPRRVLELPVETLVRRECRTPEPECPTALNATTVSRVLASAKFPDAKEAYLRFAVNNSLNPGHPFVVSVGPLKLDNSPPLTKLDIVAQGGPTWWRTAALLVLEPGDNITSVAHTEYSFDNFTFLEYNASAPPVQDREGRVPFFFRSVDAVGNREPLRMVEVNVDKQRPFGNLTINGGAASTNEANVTLTLEARDSLSGVASIRLDTGAETLELERPGRFTVPRSFPIALLAGEGERRVRARLVDQAGNVQELKATILVDTTAPEVSALRVESVGHTRAALGWRTSEPSITRIEYGPEGAEVLANRFEAAELGLAHSVALQGLRPSTVYAFRVVAEDALGNRAVQRGTFETLPDVTPPGAPHSLQVLDLGNGAVRLDWQAAFDDVGIDHYIVLRGVAGQLDALGRSGDLRFLDDRGIPGVTYDYAVQAVDLAGQVGPASIVAQGRATTRPVLSDGAVTPDRGTATTVFTYAVLVRDPDGDAPLAVRVRVAGQAWELRPVFEGRADFAQGVVYALETRLPATTLAGGFPTYQFEAVDGQGAVVWPDVPLAGPAVLGAGALIPGLSAASTLFGLPGFEVVLIAAGAGIALALLRFRRRGLA